MTASPAPEAESSLARLRELLTQDANEIQKQREALVKLLAEALARNPALTEKGQAQLGKEWERRLTSRLDEIGKIMKPNTPAPDVDQEGRLTQRARIEFEIVLRKSDELDIGYVDKEETTADEMTLVEDIYLRAKGLSAESALEPNVRGDIEEIERVFNQSNAQNDGVQMFKAIRELAEIAALNDVARDIVLAAIEEFEKADEDDHVPISRYFAENLDKLLRGGYKGEMLKEDPFEVQLAIHDMADFYEARRYDLTIQIAERCQEECPEVDEGYEYHYVYARALEAIGDGNGALVHYQEAFNLYPAIVDENRAQGPDYFNPAAIEIELALKKLQIPIQRLQGAN